MEEDRRLLRTTASSASRRPTISGAWATPAPAARARKSSSTRARASRAGRPDRPDEDGDRFLEFWNLVFMQYRAGRARRARAAAAPVDRHRHGARAHRGDSAGRALELRHRSVPRAHRRRRADHRRPADGPKAASHRVIADHLRASAFLVADGVLPSNEGRGYVLRRIMRRAMRHAQLLGAKDPLMWRLAPTLVREMGRAYPELLRAEALHRRNAAARGDALSRDAGARPRHPRRGDARSAAGAKLSGEVAFKLYDTYGFPLDLTEDALRARGIGVDLDGFDDAMERQRAEARKAWAGSGEAATETVWFALHERVGATISRLRDRERPRASSRAIRAGRSRGLPLDKARAASSSSTRRRSTASPAARSATSASSRGGRARRSRPTPRRSSATCFVHVGRRRGRRVVPWRLALELDVDHARRTAVRANHSATHLLHEALRQVLGDHVAQKGSLVAARPPALRLLASQADQRGGAARVESIANEIVAERTPVDTRLMAVGRGDSIGRARAVRREVRRRSARRLHGPSLGDGDRSFSVELCGGTHVARTGDIGLVTIVGEGRGRGGRAPHRGEDRRRRAPAARRASAQAARRRGAHARAAEDRRRASRPSRSASSSASWPTRAQARHGRRRIGRRRSDAARGRRREVSRAAVTGVDDEGPEVARG